MILAGGPKWPPNVATHWQQPADITSFQKKIIPGREVVQALQLLREEEEDKELGQQTTAP